MLTLVTGSTGYLGSELVRELRARDRPVRALVRSATAAALLEGMGAEAVLGDVTDTGTLPAALEGVDRVFHLAGVVGHRAADDARLEAVNVVGARNLLTAAETAGVERVVFTSSVAAVGPASTPNHPRDEHAFMIHGDDGRPDFRYARSKALGELEAIKAAERGLDVVIVNPGFVIGPGDVNRVSSWPIEEYLRGRLRFTVKGGLSYVDARDVVAGHLLAEERGVAGERYILTDDAGNLSHADFFAPGRAGVPQAPLPAAHAARPARAGGAGGKRPAAATPARRRGAQVERPLVVLHGGEGARADRLHHPAARRQHSRHGRVAQAGRLPQALSERGERPAIELRGGNMWLMLGHP